MRLGISTACLYGFPLDYTLGLAAACGFDGIELVMAPEASLRSPAGVARLCRAHGLDVLAVHVALFPSGPLKNSAGSLAAVSSVVMTYFGVNYFLSGLHSYAQGDAAKVPSWVYIFALCIVALITVSGLVNRRKRWGSEG